MTTYSHPGTFMSGTLAGTTLTVPMTRMPIPATVSLTFATLSTQKIEVSTDGGTTYFEPAYAYTAATTKVITLGAPVSHIKFTGVAGNTWSVR